MEIFEITEENVKKIYTTSQAGMITYVRSVGERIGMAEALRILARVVAGRADMMKDDLPKLGITGTDARAGMAVFDAMMKEEPFPGYSKLKKQERSEDTPERVITCLKGWCATLDACQMLGISTKDFCPIVHEEGLTPLVQVLNPKLQVRLGKLRPEADYCEIIVELKK